MTAGIVACLKHPELAILEDVGHLPNLEAEAAFNQALGDFLRTHAPR